MAYAVYLPDGDIKWVSNSKPVMEAIEDFSVIECSDDLDPDAFWVNVYNGPFIEARKKFPELLVNVYSKNNGYEIQIKKIPKYTTVYWPDGFDTYETDSSIECTVKFKEDYKFEFLHAAYFDHEVIVNV